MERCLTCPPLLNFFNMCPLILWTQVSQEKPTDELDRKLDYLMMAAGMFHILTIFGALSGLFLFRTTRGFCLTACLGMAFVLCNNLSNSLNIQRPIGRPF